ncbi:hypothetical protein LguiA_015721 [Lonicera macranthoides]
MEAFSLLKYWRTGAAGVCIAGDGGGNAHSASASASTTTIVTAMSEHSSESDDDEEEEEEDNDDGPFFDLEFAVPDEDGQVKDGEHEDEEKIEDDGTDSDVSDGEDDGREMKFTLSSASSGDSIDPNVSLSPSDDLFFKGRLVPIEPSSLVFNGTEANSNSKSQFPVSLVKSATKFRVLMLKLKKSKSNIAEKTESNGSGSGNKKEEQKPPTENKQSQSQSKLFTVKFKVEEVPIVSLFTRDSSSKVANSKAPKQNSDESASEEKRFSKDVMQRYLKKVKPFYVRASKRYGEKMRFSGQLNLAGAAKAGLSPPPCVAGQKSPPAKLTAEKTEAESVEVTDAPLQSNAKSQRQGNLPAGLRVVCKHLGKSRSASSAVAAAPAGGPVVSKRRDDSLLQQQDGIQSAILHCKRSFKASRGV